MSLQAFVANCLESIFNITLSLGFPSYAIAILAIAVIIRLILMPLNIGQLRSTVAMQAIQPQVDELQARYANNPELLNQKMMQLYKDYDVNPMAGCLPMLIQFPIMIGLYRGLREFVPLHEEYYSFLWISNLNDVDSTHIMVVLVALSTFLQSYIVTGKPTQAMQKYMLFAMPLMMGWMAATFPAYLCIYWIGVTVVSILQQLAVNKPMKARLQRRAEELEEQKRQQAAQQRPNHRKGKGSSKEDKKEDKKDEKPEAAEAARPAEAIEAARPTEAAETSAPKKRRRRRR